MELSSYFMPYSIVDVDHGIPVFCLSDINKYGIPSLYGIEEYLCRDDPMESCPFVLDYNGEQERRGALRPIHRYNRDQRFVGIIKKFLGGSIISGKNIDIFNLIVMEVAIEAIWDKELVWNSIRKILKYMGYSRFYDNIPVILEMVGYEFKIKYKGVIFDEIFNDFKKLVAGFNTIIGPRKYMINFRFIALKLMERHGVIFEYYIPKIQTCRKIKEFEDLWIFLEDFLD